MPAVIHFPVDYIITHVGGSAVVNRDLCNMSSPSLTTATPFKSQNIPFNAWGMGSNLLQPEGDYLHLFHILEPVLKPALPSYTIYSLILSPLHPWNFISPPSVIHIFLVKKLKWMSKTPLLYFVHGLRLLLLQIMCFRQLYQRRCCVWDNSCFQRTWNI